MGIESRGAAKANAKPDLGWTLRTELAPGLHRGVLAEQGRSHLACDATRAPAEPLDGVIPMFKR
jgi:hypothetical protein